LLYSEVMTKRLTYRFCINVMTVQVTFGGLEVVKVESVLLPMLAPLDVGPVGFGKLD